MDSDKIKELSDMNNVTIEYCMDGYNDICENVKSFKQLENRLFEIKEQVSDDFGCIFTVDIVLANVGSLTVALDEKCILVFADVDKEVLYMSLGNPLAEGTTEYYLGDYTELSNKYIIRYAEGIKAIEEWISTNQLSNKIQWIDAI